MSTVKTLVRAIQETENISYTEALKKFKAMSPVEQVLTTRLTSEIKYCDAFFFPNNKGIVEYWRIDRPSNPEYPYFIEDFEVDFNLTIDGKKIRVIPVWSGAAEKTTLSDGTIAAGSAGFYHEDGFTSVDFLDRETFDFLQGRLNMIDEVLEHPDHAVGSGLPLERVIEMLIDGEFTGW